MLVFVCCRTTHDDGERCFLAWNVTMDAYAHIHFPEDSPYYELQPNEFMVSAVDGEPDEQLGLFSRHFPLGKGSYAPSEQAADVDFTTLSDEESVIVLRDIYLEERRTWEELEQFHLHGTRTNEPTTRTLH